jgi:hypothetical protein
MPAQADAQYLTPMERWDREGLRKSPWNNIFSYASSSADPVMSKQKKVEEENWSTNGNAQSEK